MLTMSVLQDDITTISVDAVVNAANSSLLGGGGVDGAIHRKGGPAILEECIQIRNRQGGCKTGEAVFTTAGRLPAQYVIHTVGPVWGGGNQQEQELLRQCYLNSLRLADTLHVKTIAFPNISTGIFDFPKQEAATIALQTVSAYAQSDTAIEQVIFVCFDQENYDIYSQSLDKA